MLIPTYVIYEQVLDVCTSVACMLRFVIMCMYSQVLYVCKGISLDVKELHACVVCNYVQALHVCAGMVCI
jgi:hypothetical protein